MATAALIGIVVFCYKVAGVFTTLHSWEGAWQQPKLAGDLLMALVFGLVGFLAAIGVNIGTVLSGLGIKMGHSSAPHAIGLSGQPLDLQE